MTEAKAMSDDIFVKGQHNDLIQSNISHVSGSRGNVLAGLAGRDKVFSRGMPGEGRYRGIAPDEGLASGGEFMPAGMSSKAEREEWFAMSATFARELKAKSFLEEKGVPCFVAMRYTLVKGRRSVRERKLVPAINNLIFVHTTKTMIQNLKRDVPYLQYLTRPSGGRNIPITVPEQQMQDFIRVSETHDGKLEYLRPEEIEAADGTRVLINGGMFDGVEGVLVRLGKRSRKRVAVMIPGVVAVTISDFTDCYLKTLE